MSPKWIIGIDEVGRGPLAGPITVAAVAVLLKKPILKSDFSRFREVELPGKLAGIRDSKKLTPRKREVWDTIIRKNFLHTISSVQPKSIDTRGISVAAHLAVKRCLQKLPKAYGLKPKACSVLLDGGLHAPARYANQKTIIKGDELHPIIAAASIVAKVHRDRYMLRLHKKLPQYGFDRHKGYGTKAHMAAIREHGLSEHHRVSFCRGIKVNKLLGGS